MCLCYGALNGIEGLYPGTVPERKPRYKTTAETDFSSSVEAFPEVINDLDLSSAAA